MYGTVDRIPPKPRWGTLYALAGAMLALLGTVEAFVPAGVWRRLLEVGIVVIAFGTIHVWVRANRRQLDLAGARDPGFRRIVEPPSTLPPVARASHREAKPAVSAPLARGAGAPHSFPVPRGGPHK